MTLAGSVTALVDRSGLNGDAHDCSDDTTWVGVPGQVSIDFDLGGVYNVSEIRVWNYGKGGGGQGAQGVRIVGLASDKKSELQLVGAPRSLKQATTCPVAPETFLISSNQVRYIRLQIATAFDPKASRVGLSELEFTGAQVCN